MGSPPASVGLVFHPGKGLNKTIRKILAWLAERAELFPLEDHPLSDRHMRRLNIDPETLSSLRGKSVPDLVLSFGGAGSLR